MHEMPPQLFASAQILAQGAQPEDPAESTESIQEDVVQGAIENVTTLGPFFGVLLNMIIGALTGLLLTLVIAIVVRFVFRRKNDLLTRLRSLILPGAASGLFLGTRVGLGLAGTEDLAWAAATSFLLMIAVAASFAWLALRILKVVQGAILDRYRVESLSDRRNRRVQTQMNLITRVLTAVIILLAVAAVLLAIPQVRALGAGIFASAGLISVVAGLAVQSTLTNVFAGFQLAFTDAIRVGDVVEIDDWNGSIEDITLSYVVMKIWDGRRIILPSSYFTTEPFTNFTRVGTAASGTVELELDWRVPMDSLRARLKALVNSTELWDGRDASMQITEAQAGTVIVRAVVSARTTGDLWDLRCLVREDMVNFIRAEHPQALYTMRMMDDDLNKAFIEDGDDTPDLLPEQAPVLDAEDLRARRSKSKSQSAPAQQRQPAAQQRKPKKPGVGPRRARRPIAQQQEESRQDQRAQQQSSASAESSDPREPSANISMIPRIPTRGSRSERRSEEAKREVPESGSTPLTRATGDSSLYTGSISNLMRGQDFAGPGPEAFQDRARQVATNTGILPVIDPETGQVAAVAKDPEHDKEGDESPGPDGVELREKKTGENSSEVNADQDPTKD